MKIDYAARANLYSAAEAAPDRATFIYDWAQSDIWNDAPLQDRVDYLTRLWYTSRLTIKQIRHVSGLSQRQFAARFVVSRINIENWESGKRHPTLMTRLMLAKAVGLIDDDLY